jgi:hypothetical protein
MKKLITYLKKCYLIVANRINKLFKKEKRWYVQIVTDEMLFV